MLFNPTLYESYELAILVKIVLAALAGGLIGAERERHGRPAGLRTHLLVAASACLMMIISEAFYLKYGDLASESVVRIDPSRTAAQIITGIGFLGAGVIIKEGFVVRGLTTAASLWVAAGIGMAFGMGLVSAGVIATLVALFSLLILKKLEPVMKKNRYLHLNITAVAQPDIYPSLEMIFDQWSMQITNVEADHNVVDNQIVYRLVVTRHKKRMGRELSKAIVDIEGVERVHFK